MEAEQYLTLMERPKTESRSTRSLSTLRIHAVAEEKSCFDHRFTLLYYLDVALLEFSVTD